MRNKLSKISCIIIALIFILTFSLQAEEVEEEKELGNLKSETSSYNRRDNIYIAKGNVRLDYKATKINSDMLEMQRDQDMMFFTGDVHLVEEDGDQIWSQELDFDLDNEILEAKNDVTLKALRKDRDIELTSDYLKIWLATDDILAQDNVVLFYDEQEIRGNRLEYSDEQEEIVVTDNAQLKEDDDWLKAEKIIINLIDDDIDAIGSVELEFRIRE